MLSVKVAIVGSRNCQNFTMEDMIPHLPLNCTQIITGGAKGIDSLAQSLAEQMEIPVTIIKPDYQAYGKSAPYERNTLIVSQADLVLAFWDMYSPGTANTISECIRLRVPIQIIPLSKVENKTAID